MADTKTRPRKVLLPDPPADPDRVYTDQMVELATTTIDPYAALRDRPNRPAGPFTPSSQDV